MGSTDQLNRKENTKTLFTKQQIGAHWNNLYNEVKTCLDYHFVQRLKISTSIVENNFPLNSKILDLGCGAGVLSEKLLQLGYNIDAADMSQDMLDYTKERLSKFDSSTYHIFKSECENINMPDNTYDVVACIGVFGYMDDVDSAIKEINRILKPGGTLIMSIRNFNNLRAFDLFNWLNLVLLKIPEKLSKTSAKKKEAPPYLTQGTSSNPNFIKIQDKPKNVIQIFEQFNFKLKDFYGVGYGPLTYKGVPITSEAIAKKISHYFGCISKLTKTEKYAKWVADISIYVFTNTK